MLQNMSVEQRRERYAKLFKYVPGATPGEKHEWIMARSGVGIHAVKSWGVSTRPAAIPESKLLLLEQNLRDHLGDVAKKLGKS